MHCCSDFFALGDRMSCFVGIFLFLGLCVWFSFIFIILAVFSPQKINKGNKREKVDELGQKNMGAFDVEHVALTEFSIPSEAEC